MIDWKTLDPLWIVAGRYGYWAVDQLRPGDGCNGTYGYSMTFKTKKDATKVANALNAAYAEGKAKRS